MGTKEWGSSGDAAPPVTVVWCGAVVAAGGQRYRILALERAQSAGGEVPRPPSVAGQGHCRAVASVCMRYSSPKYVCLLAQEAQVVSCLSGKFFSLFLSLIPFCCPCHKAHLARLLLCDTAFLSKVDAVRLRQVNNKISIRNMCSFA